jgi:uncharacterized protein YraI
MLPLTEKPPMPLPPLTPLALATLLALSAMPATPLAISPVAAAEARASGAAPVRVRPHASAPIVGRLADGAYYEVEDCTRQARWCRVSEDGYELGWVRGSQLVGAAAKVRSLRSNSSSPPTSAPATRRIADLRAGRSPPVNA